MKIFLVQHGHALSEEEAPGRPLSAKGEAQVGRMAEFIKKLPFYPEIILHSGKMRSMQTAETVSFVLGGIRMESRDYLNPGDDPGQLLKEINSMDNNIMIAGHMPFIARAVSKLLFKGTDEEIIEITNASPLIIDRTDGAYRLEGYIKNEFIK